MVILSTSESTTLDETSDALQRKANLQLVNLKCVTYVQPISLSLSMLSDLVSKQFAVTMWIACVKDIRTNRSV